LYAISGGSSDSLIPNDILCLSVRRLDAVAGARFESDAAAACLKTMTLCRQPRADLEVRKMAFEISERP